MMTYERYSPDTYIRPYWKGDVIYNETVMFMNEDEVPLLFEPTEILSVRSYDLKTEFEAGRDYVLQNGRLYRPQGSTMPYMPKEVYYPSDPKQICHCSVEGHPYLLWGDDKKLWMHQVHVTYRHAGRWEGVIPERSDKLEAFRKKAERGERVTVLFYGDSITTGCCSSKNIGIEPYADTWSQLVIHGLRRHFKNDRIYSANTAVGGMRAEWGLAQVDERAIGVNPDLMVLAFGMNNRTGEPEEFGETMKQLIDRFRAECPGTPIALVSTMLPHFRAKNYFCRQGEQEPVLARLAESYPDVALIPVTSTYRYLLRSKRDYDLNANNINHPNDFAVRLYAQTTLAVLIGDEE